MTVCTECNSVEGKIIEETEDECEKCGECGMEDCIVNFDEDYDRER